MIKTMWQQEPSKRPSYTEIVNTLQRNSEDASIASEELHTEDSKNNYIDLLPHKQQ